MHYLQKLTINWVRRSDSSFSLLLDKFLSFIENLDKEDVNGLFTNIDSTDKENMINQIDKVKGKYLTDK